MTEPFVAYLLTRDAFSIGGAEIARAVGLRFGRTIRASISARCLVEVEVGLS